MEKTGKKNLLKSGIRLSLLTFTSRLNQIDDANGAEVGLGGVGVVFRYGSDVIAGDRDCHFCTEFLIDMVDADFTKFIASL